MYPISTKFSDYLSERGHQYLVKAEIAGTEYGDDVIVDFSIDNSVALGDKFEVGTVIYSELTIKLRTQAVVPPNAKVVPYLALTGTLGDTEWLPMGEFYIDSREQINDVWLFTCYDKLVFADVAYISSLTYPTTQQAVWNEICTSLGYIYDGSVVINPAYQIQAGPAGYSKRQVLGYIASANGASIFVNKIGTVKFKRFSASEATVVEIKKSDYIRAKQTNPVKTFTRVVVTYNTEDGLTYEAGSGDDNHTLYVENPFATQAITNDLLTTFNGFYYQPVNIDARGFPQIEAGDRIRYGEYVGTPAWQDASTAWQDTTYSWDGYIGGGYTYAMHTVYNFKGGLKMSIEAQSKSEQQSEFVVEGTLTQQVNKLTGNLVRQGVSYYGATITRTEGLIVEREDHASKVILNSDMMAFQAGGVDKIYFDPVAGKYKFNGTLEATDGIFTGALQGGTILIGSGSDVFKADANGIYLGHNSFGSAPFSVNMQGHLFAFNAEIQGNISASTISGGTISGTTMSASTITGGTITGGTITGTTINGGTITGSLIQTSASYPRAAMNDSSNVFGAYKDASNYVEMNANYAGAPVINAIAGGAMRGQIGSSGSNLFVSASSTLDLSSGGDINLTPGGLVRVGSLAKIYDNSASKSLQDALNEKQVTTDAWNSYGFNLVFDAGTRNLKMFNRFGVQIAIVNIP